MDNTRYFVNYLSEGDQNGSNRGQLTQLLEDPPVADDNACVKTRWRPPRDTIHPTNLGNVGCARCQRRDRFDSKNAVISDLLVEKNTLHRAYLDRRTDANKADFYQCRRLAQQRLRSTVPNQRIRTTTQLRWIDASDKEVADSKVLCQVLQECHQSSLRNFRLCHLPAPQIGNNRRPGSPAIRPETIRVVHQLSNRKASGSDTIPARIYKYGDHRLMDQLITQFQEIWRCGQVPQDFKGATIVHLYKRKVNRQVCENHRDILLSNITGKIFVHILLNCVHGHLKDELLPESQRGLRRRRDTIGFEFAAHQLQKKCTVDANSPLHYLCGCDESFR
ncbi:hypothetical protein SprV_0200609600 [Sparganum proliferum]